MPAAAAPHVLPTRHVPAAASAAPPLGPVPDGQVLRLTLGLQPRDPDGMAQRLRDVYDPHSPLYRHYLKPDQIAEAFGPSQADYQAVLDFAAAHGWTVTRAHRSRLLLSVRARAKDVQAALHLGLRRYARAEGGEYFAPDQEPSLDRALPLRHISGLDNLGQPRRRTQTRPLPGPLRPRPRGAQTAAWAGTGPADSQGVSTYWGGDLREIYLPCSALDGSGQTVALVEFDNYYDYDLSRWATLTGQGQPSLTRVMVDQTTQQAPGCNSLEVSGDMEMVMALAPRAAIWVYEAPFLDFGYVCQRDAPGVDLLAAVADDDQCQTVSCSWGWSGGSDANLDAVCQQFALQGQSF
ncbi:MAG TPA: protease pro-enzyme activation domain-containing protein, partial [bacterium]|nr:protease pro-enzyme activation domain-containing protein [bacterium]